MSRRLSDPVGWRELLRGKGKDAAVSWKTYDPFFREKIGAARQRRPTAAKLVMRVRIIRLLAS
jgi:hypothetical protein